MVKGLEKFQANFASFGDRYILIGGTATSLLLEELGLPFRATKDLDIVLSMETLDPEFARQLWAFIRDGGYQNRQKSSGKSQFYRFSSPGNSGFPETLELFSRFPVALELEGDSIVVPIPIGDEVSSLSAILLDTQYYQLIQSRKRTILGLTIASAETLILLKARAFLDLLKRKEEGYSVDSTDIKKHRNDVFRFFTILDPGLRIFLPPQIQEDFRTALERFGTEKIDLKSLGIKKLTLPDVITSLREIFSLTGG